MSDVDATPDTGNSAEEVDWQKRFVDTQSAYTQSQQELAALRGYETDEEKFLELARKHGYGFEEPVEEQPDYGDDQLAAARAEIEALKSTFETRVSAVENRFQQADIQTGRQQFNSDLDRMATESGVELDEFDRSAIFQRVLDADVPGPDAARAVFDEFTALARERNQRAIDAHIAGKRKAVRPAGSSGEAAGNAKPFHEMTEKERVEWMTDRAQSQQV